MSDMLPPGYTSENHGDRSRLEELAAAGGGGGEPGAPPGPEGAGGPPGAAPPPAPPQPFMNPMFGDDGEIIPGQGAPPTVPLLPDDPDLPLRMLASLFPHPDLEALLEPRDDDAGMAMFEGVDVMGGGGEEDEDELLEMLEGIEEEPGIGDELGIGEGGAGLDSLVPTDPSLPPPSPGEGEGEVFGAEGEGF